MARISKMEKYSNEIRELIDCGASIMSTWKILNARLLKEQKISYTAFYHFVIIHIKNDKKLAAVGSVRNFVSV